MRLVRKLLALLLGILILFLLYVFRGNIEDTVIEWKKKGLPSEVTREQAEVASRIAVTSGPSSGVNLPSRELVLEGVKEINLRVPFSPQAPFANWNLPYQEACEEASALLVHKFFQNATLTPEIADEEIQKIVEWEKRHFGYYEHTTALDTARLLNDYFGYNRVEVQYDISLADIKANVAAGRPVILPLAGRELHNPYYRQPGPVYHMLVVKGFTQDGKFITNDVGTRRGENYAYDENVLYQAIHDVPESGDGWKHPKPEEYILTGRKAMVVVYPRVGTPATSGRGLPQEEKLQPSEP